MSGFALAPCEQQIFPMLETNLIASAKAHPQLVRAAQLPVPSKLVAHGIVDGAAVLIGEGRGCAS